MELSSSIDGRKGGSLCIPGGPDGRIIGYFACLVRDAYCVLNRRERIKRRNTESRRHNKSECLGEVPEYGHVVFQASEERPFHAIDGDGDGAHMCPPLIEPRIDEGSSCGIAFAEQCRHHGIGKWLCVRLGKV